MAQKSAYLLGAERVIAIDRLPERLAMAQGQVGSQTINYEQVDSVVEKEGCLRSVFEPSRSALAS